MNAKEKELMIRVRTTLEVLWDCTCGANQCERCKTLDEIDMATEKKS